MTTQVLRILDRTVDEAELRRVGAVLREGGLVAFPTETVYGIAVSAEHAPSVERLYALKERPRDKPMTVMVADAQAVRDRCDELPAKAVALMRAFWPGPLTLVLPARMSHQTEGRAGLVGFRLPSHPLARGLVRAAGVPLLVPSANRSGQEPASTADEVLAAFPTELDVVIDGGPAQGGVSSSVVQVVGDKVKLLREGAIPRWRIEHPETAHLLFVCAGNTDRSPLAEAIVRRRLATELGCSEAQLSDLGFSIQSAGLAATPGRRASRRARAVAREAFTPPIDLDGHRSRKVTQEMVDDASRIFCMEREQRDQILAFFPHRVRDVFLLDPEGEDIEDPVGRGRPAYDRLAKRLDAASALIVGSLVR